VNGYARPGRLRPDRRPALGTPDSTSATDHYGFVAEQVGLLSVGGTAFALHAARHNDGPLVVGATGDLDLFQVR
jgi:hypothetical protein